MSSLQAIHKYPVGIPPAGLEGELSLPEQAAGMVLFAHGSGSSRRSSRNRFVADVLLDAGLATLLMDLLTAEEEAEDVRTARLRFDIDLLARRVREATEWKLSDPRVCHLPLGYFGASTGAAAALIAAAVAPQNVSAVVSRGGRPDLAGEYLGQVQAPTLLIVGGEDRAVIGMNERAAAQMRCRRRLEIVPGAGHLFEEHGTLEIASGLARNWFLAELKG